MSIAESIEPNPGRDAQFAPDAPARIITAKFSVSSFAQGWGHCHQLANFLARFASANEGDPERHATLLSTFINEMLEVIYRHHADTGAVTVTFERRDERVLIHAEIPVDEELSRFYRDALKTINRPDLLLWYKDQLELEEEQSESFFGLIDLVAVYGCTLTAVEKSSSDRITLTLNAPINEAEDGGFL
jgi:hypothetical protein